MPKWQHVKSTGTLQAAFTGVTHTVTQGDTSAQRSAFLQTRATGTSGAGFTGTCVRYQYSLTPLCKSLCQWPVKNGPPRLDARSPR